MDMTLVDVTDVADLQLDDMATLLGADGAERIRAEQMAGWAGTIAYEIFTGLGARLPRTYVDESPEDGAVAQRLTSPTS